MIYSSEELLKIFKHDLKLLEIDSSYEDEKLQRYLNKAKKAIIKYCRIKAKNWEDYNLQDEQLELAQFYYTYEEKKGITKYTVGKVSIEFETGIDVIPKCIKDSLPRPKIVMW